MKSYKTFFYKLEYKLTLFKCSVQRDSSKTQKQSAKYVSVKLETAELKPSASKAFQCPNKKLRIYSIGNNFDFSAKLKQDDFEE